MEKKWRVTGINGKEFETLAEAKAYRKILAASLPEDVIIDIEHFESGYGRDSSEENWIPTNH